MIALGSNPPAYWLAAALGCGLMVASMSSSGAAADADLPGSWQPPKTPPAEPLPDYAERWRSARPVAAEELALWRDAVAALGGAAHTRCAYTRWTAPCPHCGGTLPRVHAEATQISLAPGLSRWLPLSVWFDTPVMHEAALWVAERFDPRRAGRPWLLLSVDARPPNSRELADYVAEKSAAAAAWARAERIAGEKGMRLPLRFHPAGLGPSLQELPPTVALGERGGAVVLGRPPERGASHPAARGMQFTYVLDPGSAALKAVDQRILRPFSPHFGLRFRAFRQFAVLERVPAVGADVVVFQQQVFSGSLTLVFPLEQHHSEWFGRFDCPPVGGGESRAEG